MIEVLAMVLFLIGVNDLNISHPNPVLPPFCVKVDGSVALAILADRQVKSSGLGYLGFRGLVSDAPPQPNDQVVSVFIHIERIMPMCYGACAWNNALARHNYFIVNGSCDISGVISDFDGSTKPGKFNNRCNAVPYILQANEYIYRASFPPPVGKFLTAQGFYVKRQPSSSLSFANFSSVHSHLLSGYKSFPNEKNTKERYYRNPKSNDEHSKCPYRHILLSLQIVLGLTLAAIGCYIVGQTCKPIEDSAIPHDGPIGIWALLGGALIIFYGLFAFGSLILLITGCDMAEIASITGHSLKTVQDVLKHYLGMHPELARSAIAKLTIWAGK